MKKTQRKINKIRYNTAAHVVNSTCYSEWMTCDLTWTLEWNQILTGIHKKSRVTICASQWTRMLTMLEHISISNIISIYIAATHVQVVTDL
jgi:hypothetical protein